MFSFLLISFVLLAFFYILKDYSQQAVIIWM
ncbi:exported hypothetical protein [uncultured delta proteobacterium]|uniref:Uncharacterized protein n=1 Tax=uncultured delta proteobacterium TaxID=34034 RepID=A0A212JKK9_9DELT|nr:exported hypothetical protein [uncultured delta proteobacterium]